MTIKVSCWKKVIVITCLLVFITWSIVNSTIVQEWYQNTKIRKTVGERLKLYNHKNHCRETNNLLGVLLVIAYHYPFYESVPVLQEFYGQAFTNITICGASKPIVSFPFLKVPFKKGYYSYECLGKAIRTYPNFKGYLFINDDMIVNWWVLQTMNLQKLWLSKDTRTRSADPLESVPQDGWTWWEKSLKNCSDALNEVFKNKNSFNKSLETFLNNNNHRKLCTSIWADFFYVPGGEVANNFQEMSAVFFKNKVFLEIAVPTIFNFLDKKENINLINGVYLPSIFGHKDFSGTIGGHYLWSVYNYSIPFVHPVKFHNDRHNLNKDMFYVHVFLYGKKINDCNKNVSKLQAFPKQELQGSRTR